MLVIAKSIAGQEYLYKVPTAHKVSKASAGKILGILNNTGWQLSPGEIWHVYEVDEYDAAYSFGESQKFIIRKGIVKRIGY